jgi:hypothetical protein
MNTHSSFQCRFREEQRFNQWWLYVIVGTVALITTILFGYAMFRQLLQGQPWGDRPMSDTALAVMGPLVILLGWGVVLLVRWMSLVVEVQENGVFIRFRPFVRREILLRDIRRCETRTYRPVWEYGGWGLRFGLRGRAYNVSGNRGVQLELVARKRILIGSQRPEELALAIAEGLKRGVRQ